MDKIDRDFETEAINSKKQVTVQLSIVKEGILSDIA